VAVSFVAMESSEARVDSIRAATGEPRLVFVHVPRTGGATLKTFLGNYGRPRSPGNYLIGPERTRDGVEALARGLGPWRVAAGHVPLGLFRRCLPSKMRYISVLRDPVNRVLSHYQFHKADGNQRLVWEHLATLERRLLGSAGTRQDLRVGRDGDGSLEEGLRRRVCLYDNLQTRFLYGGESLFGELPGDALDRARENLRQLWFVGITERLDESMVVLGRKLGFGAAPYKIRHVTGDPPQLEGAGARLRELICEQNQLDLELYRYARDRFDAEVETEENLDAATEELRRLASPMDEENRLERKDKKAARRAARLSAEGSEAAPGKRKKRSAPSASGAGGEGGVQGEILERVQSLEDRLFRLEKDVIRLTPSSGAPPDEEQTESAEAAE
jgi:hypothetical protein